MNTDLPLNSSDIFFEVFSDVPFPLFFGDLGKLHAALEAKVQTELRSHCALAIDVSAEKRSAVISSLRGILRKIDVPPSLTKLFANSSPVGGTVGARKLMTSASVPANFAIVEHGDYLVWEENSLWPVVYSTCLEQFQNIMTLHRELLENQIRIHSTAMESKGFAAENVKIVSEYPRQLPTRFHYAAASLGAWIGGAINVQYFSCYAAIRQIHHSPLNIAYSRRIGYDSESAQKLDASGIIALPASLIGPLFEAQGSMEVFGSIGLDEFNLANPPSNTFIETQNIDSDDALPGFIADKYYRAPFRARKLGGYGFYGTKDVLRDHYEKFYANLKPESLVRCKHYCAPVITVRSIDELRALVSMIPIHDEGGVFYRGQACLYTLQRDADVRKLLFGESCSIEPSLTTSASRDQGCDYERLHFAVRYFLEQDILKRQEYPQDGLIDRWRTQSVSPDCKVDSAILALAQHYGLPSHGLDVTDSDDVALWFATNRFMQGGRSSCSTYQKLRIEDWSSDPSKWPVIIACQCVTQSIRQSLHDCLELADFGFHAQRPIAQRARFFQGGHSDHQNRLAEAVVCVFRLAPGDYATQASFDSLFPPPDKDAAYRMMLNFSDSSEFGGIWGHYVNKFH